jgi:hypothetical protein
LHGPKRKHRFQQNLYCCMRIHCRGNVFTKPLPRNGTGTYAYLAVYTLYTLQYYMFYYYCLRQMSFRIGHILIRQT